MRIRVVSILGVLAAVALALGIYIIATGGDMPQEQTQQKPAASDFALTSTAFAQDEYIPARYTCLGDNVSPPLQITHAPAGTKSFALILHDPDAPAGDWVHWTVWNMPADISTITEATVPDGAIQGKNDFGNTDYGGPCPPSGTHHYIFELYALDDSPSLPVGATREQLLAGMNQHVLAKTVLVGLVSH